MAAETQILARLSARVAIAELCSNYCHCCDTADLDGLCGLFTEDARVGIPAFGAVADGRDAIRALFHQQFSVIVTSNHWTHDLVLQFPDDHPGTATGRVAAHAEVAVQQAVLVGSMVYDDRYESVDDRWLIRSRRILFRYYLPVQEFAARYGTRDRVVTANGFVAADVPEPRAETQG